ncbi:RNA helicase [Anaerococcus sp. NML200537]|uniref:RNA helicase n=1 Tax=Anaerococcus sp. NML200537 TaxID=2954485 RepID=UPI0022380A6C|nr:RNA helicase [Anaerococcus sp. NML200537]MCW6701973.1 RNA helicase [Anaerococcus sp. NML200537]
MKKLIIMLDFISGPLWKDVFDTKKKELVTGIDCVDNDAYIQKLNNKISDLYSSYYKIDYNDQPVYFDKDQEKKDKHKMLDLLGKLIKRLDELNDGSFEVDDRETERVKNL